MAIIGESLLNPKMASVKINCLTCDNSFPVLLFNFYLKSMCIRTAIHIYTSISFDVKLSKKITFNLIYIRNLDVKIMITLTDR